MISNISININSIFYVFYEQYLTIWRDTMFSLTISLATIFTVSFVLVGFDLIAATVIALMVLLIVINMGGIMWLCSISLNAISLVNLVVVSNYSESQFKHVIQSKRSRGNAIIILNNNNFLISVYLIIQ